MTTLEFDLKAIHYDIVVDPSRFKVVIAGRRFNKTGMLLAATAEHLAEPCQNVRTGERLPHNIGYYAPTYSQAESVFWERAISKLDALIHKVNKQRLKITFRNGGTMRLWGTDQEPDKLRGGYDSLGLFDEFAFHKTGIYESILRPKLSDTQARAYFVTSPNGFNHAYDFWQRGNRQDEGFASWRYPSVAGGYITESEVLSARRDMSENKWRQEYLAEFVGMEGRVVLDWSFANVDLAVQYDPALPIYLTCDFNVNPMCWALAHRPRKDEYLFFDEIAIPNTNVQKAAEEVARRYQKHRAGVIITGDASGKSRSVLANETAYPQIKRALEDARIPNVAVDIRQKNPGIQDRVDAFNKRVSDGSGGIGVRVNPAKCPRIIFTMENARYVDGSSHIYEPTQKDFSLNPDFLYLPHMFDAVTYLIERYSPLPKTLNASGQGPKMTGKPFKAS